VDLVRTKVDVIVTGAAAANQPAKDATKTIPIIMAAGASPVESGLVASLARPGGNITGLSLTAGPEIAGKNVELLKEAVPRVSRVAVLLNTANPSAGSHFKEAEIAARAPAVTLQRFPVRGPNDFEPAFSAMTRAKAGALLILTDVLFWVHRGRLVGLWKTSQRPTMWAGAGAREFVTAGALMGYGPSVPDLFRRAAVYVTGFSRARSRRIFLSNSRSSSNSSSISKRQRRSASQYRIRWSYGQTRLLK